MTGDDPTQYPEKYWHYRVRLKGATGHRNYAVVNDVTFQDAYERVVEPARQGRRFAVAGTVVPTLDDAAEIQIVQTPQPRSPYADQHNAAMAARGIGDLSTDRRLVPFVRGADYTSELLFTPVRDALGMRTGEGESAVSTQEVSLPGDARRVFVVHGRNDSARSAMFEFLRAIGLQPVEWSEARKATGKPNPYVHEILDAGFSMARAAVVLFTPDDLAILRQPFRKDSDPEFESRLTGQARPNVLYEAGYAMGRFPGRVVLVELGRLRAFTDIGGMHMMRISNGTEARQELLERLEDAQCAVNRHGTDWHRAGNIAVDEPSPSEGDAQADREPSPGIEMVLGATSYQSPAGGDVTATILEIAVWASFTNTSATTGAVAALRLEIDGFAPIHPNDSDVIDSPERRKAAMDHKRVLFARVEPGTRWLRLPVTLTAGASDAGWVGFRTTELNLTRGALTGRSARLVARATGGREIVEQLAPFEQWQR